jgi:hypothetical protein
MDPMLLELAGYHIYHLWITLTLNHHRQQHYSSSRVETVVNRFPR